MVVAVLGLVSISGAAQAGPMTDRVLSDAPEGRSIFAKYCSFCHELRTLPADASAEPGVRLAGAAEPLRVEALIELLLGPPSGMPVIQLSSEQLSALVEFLTSGAPRAIRTDSHHP